MKQRKNCSWLQFLIARHRMRSFAPESVVTSALWNSAPICQSLATKSLPADDWREQKAEVREDGDFVDKSSCCLSAVNQPRPASSTTVTEV